MSHHQEVLEILFSKVTILPFEYRDGHLSYASRYNSCPFSVILPSLNKSFSLSCVFTIIWPYDLFDYDILYNIYFTSNASLYKSSIAPKHCSTVCWFALCLARRSRRLFNHCRDASSKMKFPACILLFILK